MSPVRWDDAPQPRSVLRPWALALIGVGVVIAAAALASGTSRTEREPRSAEVLEVTTAHPTALPLPEVVNADGAASEGGRTPTPAATPIVTPTPIVPGAGRVSVFATIADFGPGGPDLSIRRVEPATGRVVDAPLAFEESVLDTFVPFGDGLAVVTDGEAVTVSMDLEPGASLGPAEAVAAPSRGDHVWLLSGDRLDASPSLGVRAVDTDRHEAPVTELANYARVVGATQDGLVVQRGQEVALLEPAGAIRPLSTAGSAIAVSDEGVALLTCEGGRNCSVVVVGTDGEPLHTATAPPGIPDPALPYAPAALSPDNQRLAFGDTFDGGSLSVLDVADGTMIDAAVPALDSPPAVAWTPDGRALVATVGGGLAWWTVGTGAVVSLTSPPGRIFGLVVRETP